MLKGNSIAFKMSTTTLAEVNERKKAIQEWLSSKNVVDLPFVFDIIGLYERAAKRVLAVMNGDGRSESNPLFTEQFEEFCTMVPAWSPLVNQLRRLERLGNSKKRKFERDEASSVESFKPSSALDDSVVAFWEQVESFPAVQPGFVVNQFLILRQQLSGNCYLHAVVALEHYMVCLGTKCEDLKMINMGLYARGLDGVNSQSAVIKFLTKEGGNSAQQIISMCRFSLADMQVLHLNAHTKEMCESVLLKIYDVVQQKPLLVRAFEVYPTFQNMTKFSYGAVDIEEAPPGVIMPNHSLIMIGARRTDAPGEGGYYYLLQHWWAGKYFVEVSATYLQHCLFFGFVMYIVSELTERIKSYPVLLTEYAESALELEEVSGEEI